MLPLPSLDELILICQWERDLHPQARWQDYYKICLQSCFGPAHYIAHPDQVQASIKAEFGSMNQPYLPLIQPLRSNYELARISLSIMDETIQAIHGIDHGCDVKFLSDVFVASAECFSYHHNSWLGLWHQAESCLESSTGIYVSDRQLLAEYITKQRNPSHSDNFAQHYEPHYRVIKTSYLKQVFPGWEAQLKIDNYGV